MIHLVLGVVLAGAFVFTRVVPSVATQTRLEAGRDARRVSTALTVLVGGGLGASWGIVARLWMRLIAERPEFSWGGTIFIVAAPTIVGAAMGLGFAARRNRWRRRWQAAATTVAGVSVVVLGVGAGSLTLPTIVLGGVAVSRRQIPWPVRVLIGLGATGVGLLVVGDAGPVPLILLGAASVGVIIGLWTRRLLGALAFAPVVVVWITVLEAELPLWRTAVGVLGYVPLVALAVAAYGRAIAPLNARVVEVMMAA
jgi:hypothetical protein